MALPTLLADVKGVKDLGVNVGMYSTENSTHVVRFALDTGFLNKFTAKQWGVVPNKPVVIQLKFEDAYTAADDIPGVFIFQSSDSKLSEPSLSDYETEFGVVQWFLETRLTEALRSNWEKRPDAVRNLLPSTSTSASSPSTPTSSPTKTSTTTTSSPPKLSPTKTNKNDVPTSASTPSPSSVGRKNSGIDLSIIPIDDTLLEQLKGVGFSDDLARSALRRFTNDFEMALNYLLTTPADEVKVTDTEAMLIDSGGKPDVSMETQANENNNNNNNNNNSTPEKGKKRVLNVSDDDNFARLVGMGFDVDEVSEVLAVHPSGTTLEVLKSDINNRHTPKKARNSSEQDEKIEVLKGLGLSHSEATIALECAQGDLAKAVELMEPPPEIPPDEEEEEGDANQLNYVAPGRNRRRGVIAANKTTPTKGKGKGKKGKHAEEDDLPPTKNEVNLWNDTPFLVNVYNYITMRFITCPNYCLICDRDMDISTYKLPVCNRSECARVYESTACGSNQVITEIKTQPAVVELLLNLLSACMTSPLVKGWNRNGNVLSSKFDGSDGSGVKNNGRRYGHVYNMNAGAAPQSFEPFPYNLGFEYDNGGQNIRLLQQTLDAIPAISELQQCGSDAHLQALLDEVASPLAFPLLRWLLRSSRAHLSLIPEHKQITEMGTPYQFQIVSANPEHERTFQKWKQEARVEKPKVSASKRQQQIAAQYGMAGVAPQYVPRPGGGFMLKPTAEPEDKSVAKTGSFHAFHGSPISNWHSIIRTGLRGGHVPGIYMAQAAAVSQGYMQSGTQCSGWKNSKWDCDKNMSCMGMVEVADMCYDQKMLTGISPVDVPTANVANLAGIINVAMDYSIVVTRYLFFWPRGLLPDIDPVNNGYAYGASPFQNVIASKLIKNEFLFIDDSEKEEDAQLKEGNHNYIHGEESNEK